MLDEFGPERVINTPISESGFIGLGIGAAIRDDNVVIFCVHKHLYGSVGRMLAESSLSTGDVPEEEYTIPLGVAEVKREGNDITVVANLRMLHQAMNMAVALADEGISVEVVDPRTLVPLDIDTIVASVNKTGRLLIVEENNERGGWGAQVAAEVASRAHG